MATSRAGAKKQGVARGKRRPSDQATLTTAFLVAGGPALPEGATGFQFRAPGKAAEILAGRPAKIKPLLQQYGKAIARSFATGRPVSFRVDVDPSGSATVLPFEEQGAGEAYAVEETDEPSPTLQNALHAARERGRLRAAEILSAEDMVSADEFAKALGTTRVTVNAKRQNGQVLGLDGAKRGFRFPLWQLDANGKPYAELSILQERLGGPWALYRFLVQPQGALKGLSGREALARGRSKAVLAAAEGVSRGEFR